MTATVKLINNKWHCIDSTGKNWCAFARRDWAEEVAKAHGWTLV